MDRQAEIRDFLMSRRARITPEAVGLPTYGGIRRVPGLRREEVAQAAAISVDYYNRLERGKVTGVSTDVLASIARTLCLDEPERDYLFGLFQSGSAQTTRRRRTASTIRPVLGGLLDSLEMPAFIEGPTLDIIGANHAGRALYSWLGADFALPFSIPRFLFLDPRGSDFYPDLDRMRRNAVALLRAQTGRTPDSAALLTLIGELASRSEQFRKLWAAHDVRRYREGPKRFRHPVAGDLEFVSESLDVAQDSDLTLIAYTIEPGSKTADAMRLLGSWTAGAPSDSSDRDGRRSETSEPTPER